ncbi:hypothetical protein [Sphingomonas sp. EC-HK361]|uniref:hypothetical protein n=1 Tax=Sphingomonas sp. EC-HK361 TaxID=2038397 RepID=UPI00125F46A4|nr:hypothetical protein [Sphingomonas sp. EC-HK361]
MLRILVTIPVLPMLSLALTEPAIAKDAKDASGKKICRSQTFTGSRMPVRTCRTAVEWSDAKSAAGKDVDMRMRMLGNISRVQTDHVGTPVFE